LCWHGARSTWLRRCFRLKTNSDSRIVDAMARIESLSYRSNSPLAFCPKHGLFVFTGMAATGNAKLSFSHCGTNCPTCGGSSEILPGLYEPDGANIRLLLDPNVSAEALDALQKLLRAVLAGEMTPEDAIKEAEKVHRGWGKLFNISEWSDQAKATLFASILTATAAFAGARMSSPPPVTVNVDPPTIVQSVPPTKRDLLGSTSLNVAHHFSIHGRQHRPEPHISAQHKKKRR
jgi:hypothetical protein